MDRAEVIIFLRRYHRLDPDSVITEMNENFHAMNAVKGMLPADWQRFSR